MSVNVGVWIDHKQAILVRVTDTGSQVKKIASGIASPSRSRANNAYTPKDKVSEDRLERKLDSHLKKYYDEVIAGIQGSDSLLILGPGEAKGELQKRCASRKLSGFSVEVETADKMTDRQITAKVLQHFASARVSVAPKKAAKSKSTQTSSQEKTGRATA